MRKPRPILEFTRLTPHQKNQLYSWFEQNYTYDQLCAKAAQPAPDGFGFKISRDKMFRYYHRWQEIRDLHKEDNSVTVEAYEAFLNGDPGQLTAQSILRIKAQAFKITPEQKDPAKLLKLLHVFDHERLQHLAERRLYFKERLQELSARRQQIRAPAQGVEASGPENFASLAQPS